MKNLILSSAASQSLAVRQAMEDLRRAIAPIHAHMVDVLSLDCPEIIVQVDPITHKPDWKTAERKPSEWAETQLRALQRMVDETVEHYRPRIEGSA